MFHIYSLNKLKRYVYWPENLIKINLQPYTNTYEDFKQKNEFISILISISLIIIWNNVSIFKVN
jgi:hypothetical protein